MNDIVNADYQIVQERTLSVIVSEILTIEQNVAKVAMDGMIQIGNRLHEAKEQVEHGDWELWCQENLKYSKSQAARFMQIATEYGNPDSAYSNLATLQDLSFTKALKLLQVPEDEVEEFVSEHPVDELTVKELQAEIDNLKAEKDAAKEMAETATETAASAEKDLVNLRAKLDKKKSEIANMKAKAEIDKKTREAEIKARIEEANAKAREEFEAGRDDTALRAEIESLKKKLANSSDESKLKFKIIVDQLQEVWKNCMEVASKDPSGKMMKALGIVVENMSEALEED